jgi:hypothetical protein
VRNPAVRHVVIAALLALGLAIAAALQDDRPLADRVPAVVELPLPADGAEAETLNDFPSPASLALLLRLGVHHVVLGDGFSDDEARHVIAAIPRRRLVRVDSFDGGYLVELT